MYSRHRMPRHSGGLTGFGYGGSLGGLLLGGVKKADMTEAQLASYARRLEKLRNERAAANELKLATGEYRRTDRGAVIKKGTGGIGRNAHLHNMLKRLIDAEKMGAELERPEHPELAKYLDEDALYNIALYDSNRYPKFYTDKFSKKYYGQNKYNELFPAAMARSALSEERKAAMQAGKDAARGKQKYIYLDSRGNRKILTEGTKAFLSALNTKRVQEDPSLLQPK